MRLPDLFFFSSQTLLSQRFRGLMILCAMSLGVAAVLVLTALGEGARGYVIQEFSTIGKDVLIILPGRKETTGGSMPPLMGTAARDITLDEASMLPKRIAAIKEVAPVVIGSTNVSYQERNRDVITIGSTNLFARINKLTFIQGINLSGGDFRRASGEALIGVTIKKALFDNQPALGKFIRIGDTRFRIVGVLAEGGDGMSINFDEAVVIPVAAAQRLFNVEGLFRVLIQIRDGYTVSDVKKRVEDTMREFHQGELDITIISPDAMRATFDSILATMTIAIGAIGAISLLVAGILIMNVMLISVSQRTREIGLLKAIGASSNDIMRIFLSEAVLMTSAGAILGLLLGSLIVCLGTFIFPDVPFRTPLWAIFSAVIMALLAGLAFAWIPAKRASQLQPVEALHKP
jgi:putative ABC transport system permease protein